MSLITFHALRGRVVAGSSHLFPMLWIAGNASSSTNHSLSSSFQAWSFGSPVALVWVSDPVHILVSVMEPSGHRLEVTVTASRSFLSSVGGQVKEMDIMTFSLS